jgi:exodeoxyribonuclease VII large subunit
MQETMPEKIKLSELAYTIQSTLADKFEGRFIWVTAQITDVKIQTSVRRCYLKFIEKSGQQITAELRGVFWSKAFDQIEDFEKLTGQKFADGLEITCLVAVRFHEKYGLNLDVLQIEVQYALGSLELERIQTLERLVKENPQTIKKYEDSYVTQNNVLPLPLVIQRVALVTATNSDGQRDFRQELLNNKHGYTFEVTEFLTQIQGDQAHLLIQEQMEKIRLSNKKFDVVAIVRGGGSQTDFKPFDTYELAQCIAAFPIPVLTGIGHDRNTSICDLMARQEKTPTKVAAKIIEINFEFENQILQFKERIYDAANDLIRTAKEQLQTIRRIIKSASPDTILNRGFAIIELNNRIITNPEAIHAGDKITTRLKSSRIESQVTHIS